jgi:hypothetical protein
MGSHAAWPLFNCAWYEMIAVGVRGRGGLRGRWSTDRSVCRTAGDAVEGGRGERAATYHSYLFP